MAPRTSAPIPQRAQDILSSRPIGYFATHRPDGRISVVPVAVIYDGEVIRVTSRTHTQKVRNLARDPRVTVCVPHPQNPGRYVEVRGVAEVEDDVDRSFVNTMAREWMGRDEYPYESRDTPRVKITVWAEAVSCPAVHGSDG